MSTTPVDMWRKYGAVIEGFKEKVWGSDEEYTRARTWGNALKHIEEVLYIR